MRDVRDDQAAIHAEAAQWLARLNSLPVSVETIESFFEWRKTEAHADAFLQAEAVWRRAGELPRTPALSAALDEALRRSKPRRRLAWPFGGRIAWVAAAACLVLILSIASLGLSPRGTVYSTGIGEQRSIALDDGSRLRLDTDTGLKVHYTADARHIQLLHGQAYFTVAHNADRPFTVSVGDTDVVATGTQFDVRALGDGADVALVEGSVSVARKGENSTHMVAGDQLLLSDGQKPQLERANLLAATAWTSGHLIFADAPLKQAVAEMNRYLRKPITLLAPDFADDHVSGSFDAGDSASFLTALTTTFPLTAVPAADGSIRLLPRSRESATE